MAKITNPEALEAQQAIRQHIAMTIATLKAVDMAARRDYRKSMGNLAYEAYLQGGDLVTMVEAFKNMSNKEKV